MLDTYLLEIDNFSDKTLQGVAGRILSQIHV